MTTTSPFDTPSITKQQPWMTVGIFDFGKALVRGTDFFNCTICDRPDGRWLVTRRATWRKKDDMGLNDIMAFKLDGLTPLWGKAVQMGKRFENEHFEDPRVVTVGGQTFVSACNFIRNRAGCTYPHQMISEVSPNWTLIKRIDPAYGKNQNGFMANIGHEKNWLWFKTDAGWQMVYAADPFHEVVSMADLDLPFKVHRTEWKSPWTNGHIRGGTPPVLVNGEYWTFFHSSDQIAPDKRQYHMGAYAFEAAPPFRITKITPYPILSGSAKDRSGGGKPLVVFPCGAIYEKDASWLVVGGVNDLDCFHSRFSHKDLMKHVIEL